MVTGASGAGKTWTSNALGVAACNAFFTVRYARLPELLDELAAFKDEDRLKRRKKYIRCDLLIIDDRLLEKVKPNEAREIMEVARGARPHGVPHPVLAVRAVRMARQAGQRGDSRRRHRPSGLQVARHTHRRRGIHEEEDGRNRLAPASGEGAARPLFPIVRSWNAYRHNVHA